MNSVWRPAKALMVKLLPKALNVEGMAERVSTAATPNTLNSVLLMELVSKPDQSKQRDGSARIHDKATCNGSDNSKRGVRCYCDGGTYRHIRTSIWGSGMLAITISAVPLICVEAVSGPLSFVALTPAADNPAMALLAAEA